MTFSLLQERWIPLVAKDGTHTVRSLRDALLNPADWAGIGTTNPIEVFALYRLLLAICHRAIGPGTLEQRPTLLDSWPSPELESYLETWADRFDLFHPQRPFLQVAELASAKDLKLSPWLRLAPDRASGADRLLWDHSLDKYPEAISPAQAAVALVAHLQFTTGGLVRALRSSAERGMACGLLLVTPIGSTLQETLTLSLVPQTADEYEIDHPSWEKDPPTIKELRDKKTVVPCGPADRYTWLSRALLLKPGAAITHLLYAAGLAPAESPAPDPMVAVITGKKGPFPLSLRKGRAMWRDFHALVGDKGSQPPSTIETAVEIREAQGEDDPISLLAGGLLPDQAKTVLWRLEERRASPQLLAAKGDAVGVVDKALELVESVGKRLNEALSALLKAWLENGGEGPIESVKGFASSLMPHYWAALEPEFWMLVAQLGQGQDGHQALEHWRTTLKGSVDKVWDQARNSLGVDGRALAAEGRSSKALGKVFRAIES